MREFAFAQGEDDTYKKISVKNYGTHELGTGIRIIMEGRWGTVTMEVGDREFDQIIEMFRAARS